MLRNKDHR